MPTVLIPTPLRKYTDNAAKVNIPGSNISEIIDNLVKLYPNMQKHLLDASGGVRSFINIFVDQDDIRSLQYQDTMVAPHAIISIVPAIAGGNFSHDNDEQH